MGFKGLLLKNYDYDDLIMIKLTIVAHVKFVALFGISKNAIPFGTFFSGFVVPKTFFETFYFRLSAFSARQEASMEFRFFGSWLSWGRSWLDRASNVLRPVAIACSLVEVKSWRAVLKIFMY